MLKIVQITTNKIACKSAQGAVNSFALVSKSAVDVDGAHETVPVPELWHIRLRSGQLFVQQLHPRINNGDLEKPVAVGRAILDRVTIELVALTLGVFFIPRQEEKSGGEHIKREVAVGRKQRGKLIPLGNFGLDRPDAVFI